MRAAVRGMQGCVGLLIAAGADLEHEDYVCGSNHASVFT